MKPGSFMRCCALLLIGGIALSQPQGATRSPGACILLAGDYLRDDYLENLKRTRSAFKSEAPGQPQLVKVRPAEGAWEVMTVLGFHMGGAEFSLGKDGALSVRAGWGTGTSNLTFRIVDSRRFVLGYDEFAPRSYSFVDDVERYLSEHLLAGDYVDGHGRHYIFGRDGVAHFRDGEFHYRVGTDHTFSKFDYYYAQQKESGVFGFKLAGDTLDIFRTSGPFNRNIGKAPMLSLRKSGSGSSRVNAADQK
jgi:hypothetical protein